MEGKTVRSERIKRGGGAVVTSSGKQFQSTLMLGNYTIAFFGCPRHTIKWTGLAERLIIKIILESVCAKGGNF